MLRRLTTTAAALAVLCATADAGPRFYEHEPGVTVGVAAMYGAETDGDFEFFGGTYGLVQVGYQARTGSELVISTGTSFDAAKEAITYTYGFAFRQRVHVGPVEPFLEAGFFQAGPNTDDPLAFGYGGGLDVRLPHDLAIGIAGGRFAGDVDPDEGRLDWYTRVQFGGRFTR